MNNISQNDKAWAVILAAGTGSRFREVSDIPKQFIEWRGLPLYWHSVQVFSRFAPLEGIVLVFPEEYCECENERIEKLCAFHSPGISIKICAGGAARYDSAANGLALVPLPMPKVFIHDAARPFFSPHLLWRLWEALDNECAGVIPAISLNDTIKIERDGFVEKTLHRESLRAVQTPQLFFAEYLRKANESARLEGWQVTDDASLVEKLGLKVRVIRGDENNKKITRPVDMILLRNAEATWLPCNGFGYDVHRYGSGRPLRLGGILMPGNLEVMAHSDGDVLLHALMDAMLGAGALGDIGKLFPPSDVRYEGISSAILLDHVYSLLQDADIVLTHIDLTVVAQKPRLEPWKREIARNVARLLNLRENMVSIKATTEEGLGFTGKCEGIKAYAFVSAMKKGDIVKK